MSTGGRVAYFITTEDSGDTFVRKTPPQEGPRWPVFLSGNGRTLTINQTELTSDDGLTFVREHMDRAGYAVAATGVLTPTAAATREPVLYVFLYGLGIAGGW